ncbi:MAG TPA: response regulator transcription factor [Trueperaceae bacterium]|nr:response regulator transcription factor [Trueperaceae bacterium]
MSYILLIEDDPDSAKIVRRYLEREGFRLEHASDGRSGLDMALNNPPKLIILDWMLPRLSGLELLKELRKNQQTPVIMLTARTEEMDRILGLEFGADDYVLKPFSPRELVARVKAILRRMTNESNDSELIKLGKLLINSEKRTVSYDDKSLDLTVLEFDLLYLLAKYPGKVFSRNELLDRIWGSDFSGVDRVVDVHISKLRQKLEFNNSLPKVLKTVRGIGYQLNENI